MRRALLLGVLLTPMLGGTAQAKPWLTMHQARRAAAYDPFVGSPPLLGHCSRETARIVNCQFVGYEPSLGMYCYGIRQATLYTHRRWLDNWIFRTHDAYVDAEQTGEAICR